MRSTLPDLFVEPRETLLDRRAHVEDDLALEPPVVPPLGDLLPDLRPRLVEIGGLRLFCEEQGDGMPLVLLHGGPGHSHHGFHSAFSRLDDGVRAIYYDQRGCWDLTWNTDKPDKLHRLHPHARLELFPRSGHLPFNDEPDHFFGLLEEFLAGLPIDN